MVAMCACGHPHASHADQRVNPAMPCITPLITLGGEQWCGCRRYERTRRPSGLKVSTVNQILGVDLWEAHSFRADVRIDFDECGDVLRTALLNPGSTDAEGQR